MVMPHNSKRGHIPAVRISENRPKRKGSPPKFNFTVYEYHGKWFWEMDLKGSCQATSNPLRDIGTATRAVDAVRSRLQPEFQGTVTIPEHLYSGDPGYVAPSKRKSN